MSTGLGPGHPAAAKAAKPARILITGASGCVGQYIAEELYNNSNAQLLLLLRDPAKLTAVPASDPRITLLVGDLRQLEPHAAAIARDRKSTRLNSSHSSVSRMPSSA